MAQAFFNFDDEEPPASPPPVRAPAPVQKVTWEWWDPWPEGLSKREQARYQIARDMRAFAEEDDPEMQLFFADRIASFQEWIKEMDRDERSAQLTPPATAPGDTV